MIAARRLSSLLVALLFAAACVSDDAASGPVGSQTDTSGASTSPTTIGEPTSSALETTTTTVPPPPTATTLVEPPGPLMGIAVPEGRIETILDIEDEVGETFHLIRIFLRWEHDLADSDVATLQAGGRAIHLSVRPVRSDGSVIPWADIASAAPGEALHDEMVAWADAVVALGPDARFTFNHEPETRDSAPNGDALDYRQAWRRMAELVRERGGTETALVWTVGLGALESPGGRAWYPGDDVVDVIGADLYNWFTCQGTDRPWISFEDLIEPAVAFAAERGKPLALPEFASAEDPDDPRRRAGWMDAATDVMVSWDPTERSGVELDFVAWFDVTAPGGTYPDCRWEHRTDVETRRALGRMVDRLVGR